MKKNILSSVMVLGLVLGLAGVASVTNAAVDTVSAGANQSITLPISTVTLTGSATATSGSTIASYAWAQTSGPSASTIVTPSALSTSVTGLIVGSYVFTMTASDNTTPTALTSSATTTVTVSPVVTPLPPVKVIKSKLEINPNGKVNLQGELVLIGTGTLSVKVWGITFTVNTTNAQFNGKVLDITGYKVGDMISVKGQIDPLTLTPTINARNVKNMTFKALNEQAAKKMENRENKGKGKKNNNN